MLLTADMETDELDTFKSLGTLAGAAVCELRNEERETCDADDNDGDPCVDDQIIVERRVVHRRPFGRRVADNITHVHAPVVDLREF